MGKLSDFIKKKLEKVNVQVSVLTCSLVVFSCLIIYFVTSGIMVSLLADAYNERVNLTFQTVESHIDKKIYHDDMSLSSGNAVMSYLNATKDNMAISEIFIIKKENNKIKYILDTREAEKNGDVEHKKVSKTIERQIEDLYITDYVGKGVFISTANGYRYMNFYPVKGDDKVIKGVIGIGVNAQDVRVVRIVIQILVLLIIIICCIISTRFAKRIFKKLSNPMYQDSSNTDALTGLKNKNSFSVDMHNIEVGNTKRYSVVTIDLNGLKTINDTRGHQTGDIFIQRAASAIKNAMKDTTYIGYRIGGDEFSIIMKDVSEDDIKVFVERVNEETELINQKSGLKVSMSIGYAKFDSDKDRNFSATIERSDTMMYENKRLYYQEKNKTSR